MSSVEDLVIRIQAGEPLKDELYQRIYKLLYLICGRYANYAAKRHYEIDDLVSVAWIGVEKAIQTYQTDKGAKFTFYMEYFTKRTLAAFLGFRKGKPFVRSLDDPIPGADDLTYGDTIPDPESSIAFEDIEKAVTYGEAVKIALDCLDQAHSDVIIRRFLHNQSFASIAREKNVTIKRIRQIESKALRKIRGNSKLRKFWMGEFYHNFHHVTLSRFNTTWTSTTEQAVLNLERHGY